MGGREDRWWAGYGGSGTVYLPIVMVDSGHWVTSGSQDFLDAYGAIIDAALLRSAGASLEVERELVGNVLSFEVTLTNQSGMTLTSTSGATLYAIIYMKPSKGTSQWVVQAVQSVPIPNLADGATGDYSIQVPLTSSSWRDLPAVIFVEHQPSGSSGAWDMLQAVIVE